MYKKTKKTKKKEEEKIHFYEHSFYTSPVDTYDWNSNLDGFNTEWFQLETKFVNTWLFLRLTTINKQSNNDNLRNSVIMQYPNQKINFAQRIDLSIEMPEVYIKSSDWISGELYQFIVQLIQSFIIK